MKYIIISKKKWDQKNFKELKQNFIFLKNINYSKIKKINPKIIFFYSLVKNYNKKNLRKLFMHSISFFKFTKWKRWKPNSKSNFIR